MTEKRPQPKVPAELAVHAVQFRRNNRPGFSPTIHACTGRQWAETWCGMGVSPSALRFTGEVTEINCPHCLAAGARGVPVSRKTRTRNVRAARAAKEAAAA